MRSVSRQILDTLQSARLTVPIFLLLIGFLFHTLTIVYGFIKAGHIPVSNMHETLSFAAWVMAGVFLAIQLKFNLKILGIFAAPILALMMLIASRLPN